MKTFLLCILVFFISISSHAGPGVQCEKPDMDVLIKTLQLSDDESVALQNLMQKHRAEMEALRQESKDNHQKAKALHDAHRESLLTILNYEQMYQFHEYMRQFRPHPPGHL